MKHIPYVADPTSTTPPFAFSFDRITDLSPPSFEKTLPEPEARALEIERPVSAIVPEPVEGDGSFFVYALAGVGVLLGVTCLVGGLSLMTGIVGILLLG